MNERLFELRRELKLTQNEFAKRIQISRSHLSGLENGSKSLTERVISDICREFDVNREWLETGKGDMFIDILGEIDEFANADEEVQEMVRLYMQMDSVTRAYFRKKIEDEVKK